MLSDTESVLVPAVAVVAALALARPAAAALLAAGRAACRGLARSRRAVAAAGARRAALGLLGSGAVLASGAGGAAGAPAPGLAAGTAAGPRAPLPPERDGAARGGDPAAVDPAPGEIYVVRAGDCLWGVARRHLPRDATDAQVAAAWPRWWAANRAVVGPDPDLLLPGTRLVVPPRFRSTGTSTTAASAAASFDPDRR